MKSKASAEAFNLKIKAFRNRFRGVRIPNLRFSIDMGGIVEKV
jgi:hypothetical protein